MSIKDYIANKAIEKQLKDLPKDQREVFKKMYEKNPKLFEKISVEVKERKKKGQNEMLAMTAVMKKYESEMKNLFNSLR